MPRSTRARFISLVPALIERRILLLRRERVLLDVHLADLYGVSTKALVQAVKRNIQQFPADFMFQFTEKEFNTLRSQSVTSNKRRGGRRYPPYAFTEQGVAMLSSVLTSERAIRVNIIIVRVFVRLRHLLATHTRLARRLEEMERKYDKRFAIVFDALRNLLKVPERSRRQIGFRVEEPRADYSPRPKRKR